MNRAKNSVKSLLRNIVLVISSRAIVRAFLFEWYRLRFHIVRPRGLRVHLGCGNIRKNGFLNVDHRPTGATNMVCDIKKLPFPSGSVKLIECYHVIEHIPHPEVPSMLREWYRVLQPGGRIIIECPDFDQAVKQYLEGNEHRLYNIFGLQRFPGDAHLFGYNKKRLSELLSRVGFKEIIEGEPTDYHKDQEPCLRIEGIKG